jgi:DNA invertase Pin-like site-specific DNA recombinase
MNETIRPDHRERAAYVYVRQSSLQQVRHHREGQQRQYGLADRARHVGFTRVVVIDDDLGVSGTGRQRSLRPRPVLRDGVYRDRR